MRGCSIEGIWQGAQVSQISPTPGLECSREQKHIELQAGCKGVTQSPKLLKANYSKRIAQDELLKATLKALRQCRHIFKAGI